MEGRKRGGEEEEEGGGRGEGLGKKQEEEEENRKKKNNNNKETFERKMNHEALWTLRSRGFERGGGGGMGWPCDGY